MLCKYHLTDGEAVLEVVERDLVVVHVDLTEELSEDERIDGELSDEVQIKIHLL